jgi:ferritin-like metal-binding protein YciE
LSISNPRDLVVQQLGELLYVERRLADSVIQSLADAVRDDELRTILEQHRDQTKEHVLRIETAFRRLEVAPTSNRCAQLDAAVDQHDELAPSIVGPRLADLSHAQAALQVEHWEMAAYRGLLPLVSTEVQQALRPTLDEEGQAAKALVGAIDRLASS